MEVVTFVLPVPNSYVSWIGDMLSTVSPFKHRMFGLTFAQCEQTAWAISADGQVYRETQAVSAALDAIVLLPVFLFLSRLPGIKHIEDKVYARVAKNRRFFPGIRPYCELYWLLDTSVRKMNRLLLQMRSF